MKIVVDEEYNQRIDSYLSDYFDDISRSKLSKLIKDKDILVNDKNIKPSYIVSENDIITINLEKLKLKPIQAQKLNIDIVYEDDDIAIINKPSGIISHPTKSIRENTVVNFLIDRYDNLPLLNGDERPGIVHRLDKDTDGLMIIALNEKSMIKLKEIFKNREIVKKYRTIVDGNFNDKKGIIESPIGRDLSNRKLMTVTESGKYAETIYHVIKSNKKYSYLDVNIITGRTHQIRVHLKNINHPILGDKEYNNVKNNFNISSQLLQAYYLEFNHPINDKKLLFEIDMYEEFKKYYNIIFKN